MTPTPTNPALSSAWESQLAALLDDLCQVQSELLQVLQAKQQALARADLVRMVELHPHEQRLAQRLAQCLQRREELLAAARQTGLAPANLSALANCAGPEQAGKLGNQVQWAAARMRLLQHHSLANWVLAQRALLHVAQVLEIIATGGRMQPTYGDRELHTARGVLVHDEA